MANLNLSRRAVAPNQSLRSPLAITALAASLGAASVGLAGGPPPIMPVMETRFIHIDGAVNSGGEQGPIDEQISMPERFAAFDDLLDFDLRHHTGVATSVGAQESQVLPHLLVAHARAESFVSSGSAADQSVANARSKYEVVFEVSEPRRWRLDGFAQDEGMTESFVRLQQGFFNILAGIDGDASGREIHAIISLQPGIYTIHAEARCNVFLFGVGERNGQAEIQLRFGPTTATLLGDMNCDGAVSIGDIGPFVLALTNPAGYAAQFPGCSIENGDLNGDGAMTVSDIGPFVALVTGA